MRASAFTIVLTCAVLAAAGAQAQNGQESRYGPTAERAPTPVNEQRPGYAGAPYSGRALSWSGKREIGAPQAEVPMQAVAPVQSPWSRSQQQAIAPQAAPQPQQSPQRAIYQAQAPAYRSPAPAALPQSIYEAPRARAPLPVAYSTPTQPAVARPAAQFRDGQIGARTYSVGRQFGMTPDPIPAAGPSRMVLIAPPASAPDDEDKPRENNGDWSPKPGKDSSQ